MFSPPLPLVFLHPHFSFLFGSAEISLLDIKFGFVGYNVKSSHVIWKGQKRMSQKQFFFSLYFFNIDLYKVKSCSSPTVNWHMYGILDRIQNGHGTHVWKTLIGMHVMYASRNTSFYNSQRGTSVFIVCSLMAQREFSKMMGFNETI